jgi:hypothetical protein
MSRRVASVIVALALLPVLASAVLAAGEGGAHMRPPKIEMKPAPGKLIELSVTVGFTGGCCFTLTTHNIAAALEVPPEVQVVNGPDPARYDQIVGPPGGVKQGIAEFRWRLKKAKEDAVYPIKVKITTSDSGTVEKEYTLTKPLPCNIAQPEVARPAPSQTATPVKVDVASNKDDRFVRKVTLYYLSGLPKGASDLRAKEGFVLFADGGRTATRIGQPLEMARKYEPTVWRASLPAQPPGTLYYWIVAENNAGQPTTSPVHELWVVDFGAAKRALHVTGWGLALATALLAMSLLGRRKAAAPLVPGLLALGASRISLPPRLAAGTSDPWKARVLLGVLCLIAAALVPPVHLHQLLAHWRGS